MAFTIFFVLAFSRQILATGVGIPAQPAIPTHTRNFQPLPSLISSVPQPAFRPDPTIQQVPFAAQPAPAVQQVPFASQPAPAVQQVPFASQPAPAVQQIPFASQPAPVVQQAPFASQPAPAVHQVPVPLTPVIAPPAQPIFAVDDTCLRCICLASSGCAPRACHVAGPSHYFCGSYLISWAYWADAGKPQDNPHDPHSFEKCLTHNQCAEQTVRSYMAKHGKDCNFDNRIDCLDFAKIHKSGPYGCTSSQWVDNTEYWKILTSCVANQTRIH